MLSYREILLGDPCAYCGRMPGGTIDHIVPRRDQPESVLTNATGACVGCNGAKGARSLLLFLLNDKTHVRRAEAHPAAIRGRHRRKRARRAKLKSVRKKWEAENYVAPSGRTKHYR